MGLNINMALTSRYTVFLTLCLICAGCVSQEPVQAQAQTKTQIQAPAPVETDAPAKTEALSAYKLSTGDVITITVFGEDDLKKEKTRLTDAGTISYPVLGEIEVRGKTVGALEKAIAEGLRGRYLVNPRVSVTIDEYRPFFINGQIARPGSYPYQPGLTVSRAVTVAGGFTERASQGKMFVVREGDPSGTRIKVDLYDPIHAGDTVTVGESFF